MYFYFIRAICLPLSVSNKTMVEEKNCPRCHRFYSTMARDDMISASLSKQQASKTENKDLQIS